MRQPILEPILRHMRRLAEAQCMRDLTDGELLERFRAGREEAAFTLLVERHGPMVLSVSRRVLHDWHAAEDVFQATFLVLAQKAASIRKKASVASWLHGVAHRIATKALRRSARSRRRERRSFDMARTQPQEELNWQELRSVLDEEIAELPEKYKVPLVLHYLEGKSHEQAARELAWPKTSFSSRLARARELLRERFARRGFVLSAGLLSTLLAEQTAPAALSALLVLNTVRGGSLALAGKAAAGAVSAQAAALAEEAVQAMNLAKLKVILVLVLSAGLAATGTGLAARHLSAAGQPQAVIEGGAGGIQGDARGLDADGRPLPPGAIHRLGSRRFRLEGRADFVLPTPDGNYILVHPQPALSASAAHGLILLDADTGLRVRSFEDSRRVPKAGVYDAIRLAAFSPDGTRLYALGWHKSEKEGNGFAQWANFENPCKRVLLVWDVATGKRTAEWDLPSGAVVGASLIGVNISPDGKRLYVYGAIRIGSLFDRNVRGVAGVHVLDAATGKKLQTWPGAGYPVGTTAGGKEAITFRRGAPITAHDVETGKVVRTFPVQGTVPDVTVSPDGKSVAAVVLSQAKDDTVACEIKLWEAATGREIRRLTAAPKTVRDWTARVVFAADGKTLYLAAGGRILRWDLSDGRALPDWPAHRGRIADLFFRPGKNELVSAGASDGMLHRWDAATGKALSTTQAYVGEVAVARRPAGKEIVAVDSVGRLDVWDVTTGRVTNTLQTPGRQRHQLLFTPDGKHLLVAAETGPNTIWDLSAGKAVGEFAPPPKLDAKADEYWWGTLGFSPDGRRLVASKFGRGTWMWTWPERKILWREGREQGCAFSPDGETLVCSDWHSPIQFRYPETGIVKGTQPESGMAHVAFSPDGRRMVTAHLDGAWRVRDAVTGAVLKEVQGWQKVWSVAFSRSGWLVAVAGDHSVRVYDTASWQEIARFDGHDGTVSTVFFGPDEATLISASEEDGTALVWSLKPSAGPEPPAPTKLWADLAGDGPAVRRAVWAAVQHPEAAIQLFRQKWPVPKHPIDPDRVARLIADLDSPVFARREAATAELVKLGRPAEAALRKELETTTSAEVKRRAKKILTEWAPPVAAEYSSEDARELRAVWSLELARTPEARKLLAEWAAAKVGNRLGEEAAAAMKRLP